MFGTIQSYNDLRGFGFILVAGKQRHFFHIRSFEGPSPNVPGSGEPYVGMRVSFTLGPARDPRQPDQAVHVIPVPAGTGIQAVSK